MHKKIVLLVIVVAVVVGGLAFFAGSKYAQANGRKLSQFAGQNRAGAGTGNRTPGRGGIMGGFTGGQVISKDDKSITVSARDGSSKIVFFTTATPVMKMVAGTSADIIVGQDITVMGTPNPDGSISADSIQLRPAQAPKAN